MERLVAKNITKIFPGVVALNGVDLSLNAGEVFCICGENGAGKSTLIKCLTGVYVPEHGEILIDGQKANDNPQLFERVAYVPQEIDLFSYMSVAENLFMPFSKSGIKGSISQKEIQKKAIPILEKFGIDVSPKTLVKDITVSQQQLLQIARAVASDGYEILMLDEPTTSLTTEHTEKLFEIVKQLKESGKCIVFISHKLDEVFSIGNRIAVFRNGVNMGVEDIKDTNVHDTIVKMTGHEIDDNESFSSNNIRDEVLLEVDNLTGADFKNISFQLRRGEILGFAGLVGAGRSELMQAIFGYLPVYKGSVKREGKPWKLGNTHYSIEHGMFYLPEERRSQGILADLSVRENISISVLKQVSGGLGISRHKEKALVNDTIKTYAIKTPTSEQHIKYLSGGNQQKAIIGRAMVGKPDILIFDEPTKGIDVGTKTEIYRLMKKIAEETGAGIILVSSEMNELRKCSNRIICMHEGKFTGEFGGRENEQVLLTAILGI